MCLAVESQKIKYRIVFNTAGTNCTIIFQTFDAVLGGNVQINMEGSPELEVTEVTLVL